MTTRAIEGVVSSGMGVATRVLAPCHATIEARAGVKLAPGTLNVKLDEPVKIAPDFVLEVGECNSYESLSFQRCRINEQDALIMRTSTQDSGGSHPLDVVEVMAGISLRSVLGLVDGSRVVVEARF